jgi:hypothetical protein
VAAHYRSSVVPLLETRLPSHVTFQRNRSRVKRPTPRTLEDHVVESNRRSEQPWLFSVHSTRTAFDRQRPGYRTPNLWAHARFSNRTKPNVIAVLDVELLSREHLDLHDEAVVLLREVEGFGRAAFARAATYPPRPTTPRACLGLRFKKRRHRNQVTSQTLTSASETTGELPSGCRRATRSSARATRPEQRRRTCRDSPPPRSYEPHNGNGRPRRDDASDKQCHRRLSRGR